MILLAQIQPACLLLYKFWIIFVVVPEWLELSSSGCMGAYEFQVLCVATVVPTIVLA